MWYKSISPLKEAGDFEDGESHVFRGDVARNKDSWPKENEIECRGEIMDTFGKDTGEWQEAHLEYGKLKQDLYRKISLSIGMEGVRERLDNSGGRRREMLNSQDLNRSGVNWEHPQIWGGVGDFGKLTWE